MPSSFTISDDAVNAAYTKAYLNGPDWRSLFNANVAEFLLSVACDLSSRPEIVVGLLLLVTSCLLGPGTRVLADTGNLLRPNLYLFLIGNPTTGKSPAYDNLVFFPIRKLEAEWDVVLLYQAFTSAGLMAQLSGNSGFGFVCSDEVCHEMLQYFGGSKDEAMEVRHNLNNLWSGGGYSKQFKGGAKKRVMFHSSYFCLGGTAQPQPFCMMLHRIISIRDGLEDRVLALCANPRRNHPYANPDPKLYYKLSENWIQTLYRNIYQNHRRQTVYQLSPEAKDFVAGMRKAANESYDDHILLYEVNILILLLCCGGLSFGRLYVE